MALRKPAPKLKANSSHMPAQGKGRTAGTVPTVGQYSRTNPNYSHAAAKKKSGRGKKIALAAVCAVLVLFIGVGTAAALYLDNINRALAGDRTEEEWDEINDSLAEAPKEAGEPFYMLLVGSDAREGDTVSRSDTNIVVRVDPENAVVTMVSIPRDTAIQIDGEIVKFNSAYNGGIDDTIREASELTGAEISYFAEVNFEKLIELVDAVGGVEVDVPERIDDPDAGNIVIEAGPQTLDGEAALVFARSRAYADGDFTRTSNQRLLIEGIINKVLSLPVTEMPGVIEKAAQCVTTNLSVTDIISLAMQFKDLGNLSIYSAMVPSWIAPYYINGQSFVIADEGSLAEMMKLVEAGKDPSTVEAADEYDFPDFIDEYYATYGTSSVSGGSGGTSYYDDGPIASGGGTGYTDPGYTDPGYTDPGTGGGTGEVPGTGGSGTGTGDGGSGTTGGSGTGGGAGTGSGDTGGGDTSDGGSGAGTGTGGGEAPVSGGAPA